MDTLKCYEILDVPPEADPAAIRAAYVSLAQVWQPERYANPAMREKAQAKMNEIQEAYQHLASFTPQLLGIPEAAPPKNPADAESVLVDDSDSPVQWTIIFVVLLVLSFAGAIGFHLYKEEHRMTDTATSLSVNEEPSHDVSG